jgi:hypothetical protein
MKIEKRLRKWASHVEEAHLAKELKKWDDFQEKLKEEARKREAARVEYLKKNMRTLEKMCGAGLVPGLNSDQIGAALDDLIGTEIPEDVFQENYQMACNLLGHAMESTKTALEKRKAFEAEQAALKVQTEVNEQHSWFNKNFGWSATMEDMENALEKLEKMEPVEHLKTIVEEQKITGQEILVAARAKKAEADRLEAERLFSKMWDDAHAMNAEFDRAKAKFEEVPKVQEPEIKEEIKRAPVPEIMKREKVYVSEKVEATKVLEEETEPAPISEYEYKDTIKIQLSFFRQMRASGKELVLFLGEASVFPNGGSSLRIGQHHGLESILDAIESQLNKRMREIADDM